MAPQMPERGGYPKNTMTSYRVEAPQPHPYMDPRVADPIPYQPMPQNDVPRAQTPGLAHALPPLKALSSEFMNVQPSIESVTPSPGYDSVSGKRMLYHTGPGNGKRTHEDSFGLDERAMQNGMRPDMDSHQTAYRDFSAESRAALMAELGVEMAYKRANGRMAMKVPPNVQ